MTQAGEAAVQRPRDGREDMDVWRRGGQGESERCGPHQTVLVGGGQHGLLGYFMALRGHLAFSCLKIRDSQC